MEKECFNLVAEMLQEDTLTPYLFITYLDYVLRVAIDFQSSLGFTLKEY